MTCTTAVPPTISDYPGPSGDADRLMREVVLDRPHHDTQDCAVRPSDQQRLEALVRQHSSALMARTVQFTAGDRAWADDVVQETFIRAWNRLDRMTEDHGNVRAWLLRVAHNLVIDGHRSRRAKDVELGQGQLDLTPTRDSSEQVMAAQIVGDALSTLSEGHRAVLVEVYLRDRTVADTARVLDLPVGTVKSRAHYALRQLRAWASTPDGAEAAQPSVEEPV